MGMGIKSLTALALVVGLCLALQAEALAQEDKGAQTARIKQLNNEARAAFRSYSYRGAQKKLNAAMVVANEAKINQDPAVAQTMLLMGITAVAGFNDLYRGLHYFVKAQRLDPKIQIPKGLATPQLLEMFAKANKSMKVLKKPPTIEIGRTIERQPGATKESKVSGLGLIHEPVDSAMHGFPIPIKARAGIDVQAHKVFLYFRAAGIVKFHQLRMKKEQGAFRVSIPTAVTRGRYIHYYIEAEDQRGRKNASHGSARSPNVIILKHTSTPLVVPKKPATLVKAKKAPMKAVKPAKKPVKAPAKAPAKETAKTNKVEKIQPSAGKK